MAKQTKKPRTKRELDVLRDYAFRLYLSGETQKVIASKTDLTEATISKWANEDDWEPAAQGAKHLDDCPGKFVDAGR